MKGSLAAMLVACEDGPGIRRPSVGRIGFLITSDEEGPRPMAPCGNAWLAERGIHIDYCVVGEPSSGRGTRRHDQERSPRLTERRPALRGRQGHVAYPQHADNPLHRALPALAALATRHWDRGNAHFPPTTFQITNLHAGTGATNVIPGSWSCGSTSASTRSRRRGAQGRGAGCARCAEHRPRGGLDACGAPFLTPEGALVEAAREAVREVTGQAAQLSTSGGTSDGRFIAPGGAEVVELGPVNASIHRVNEHVAVEDLPRLAQIYAALITRLLGTG
jgi:succinyl-diaminopimelate desuccinylase